MEQQMEASSTQKKVFHVMVEALQNISKHADNPDGSVRNDGRGIFMLSKNSEEYTITTGNVCERSKIPRMTETLEKINSLDKEGLKEMYKSQIKEGIISNRGGAGLGFIDIAKKTGNKLHYSFLTINNEYSFFVLMTKISRSSNL